MQLLIVVMQTKQIHSTHSAGITTFRHDKKYLQYRYHFVTGLMCKQKPSSVFLLKTEVTVANYLMKQIL